MPRLTQSGFYERGLTDFLNVLDAERQRFEIEAQYEIISLSLNLTAMSVCGARNGHVGAAWRCPLIGAKQTSRRRAVTSGFDPRRTVAEQSIHVELNS